MCTLDLNSGEERTFTYLEDNTEWRDYISKAKVLIGHNIIGYDLNVLKKLYGWVPEEGVSLHDTLLFSQMMNFRRFGFKGHGLMQWGLAMGDHKGDFHDWSQLSDEMISYCIQDVRLSAKVYKYLGNEFSKAAAKEPMLKLSLRNEHAAARYMAEAELEGWLFDKVKGIELLWKMNEEIDATEAIIAPLMGLKTVIKDRINPALFLEKLPFEEDIPKQIQRVAGHDMESLKRLLVIGETKTPKWTKKGHYDHHTAAWFDVSAESGLYTSCIVEGPYCRLTFVPRKVSSVDDAKVWLKTIGWEADDWNYKRNPETRKLEIVSEKLSESSLLRLGELGEIYNSYLTTNSRANILSGWIEACDDNWRIHGGAMCFGTPTGRMTHKLVANVPSVGNPWGADVRSLFMADPGTVQIGCDSSGNQARGFCHHLGNEEYTNLVLHGDVHQANADTLTKIARAIGEMGMDNEVPRKTAKPFYYAFLFGAGGPKLALTVFGKRSDKGNKLKEEFMKATPGLFELNEKLEKIFSATKRDTGFGYIYALDGTKVYSDSLHKVLNYLLQRFESVTVKSAVFYMCKKFKGEGIWFRPRTIYHDEVQFLVKDDPVIIERAKEIAVEAFTVAALEFGVSITGGEAKHGYNWCETH
jgi:hypothetical protein